MKLSTFLKELLYGFVDDYQKLFRKTYSIALIWTICTAAVILVLCKYSTFDNSLRQLENGLVGLLYYHYSDPVTYRVVDLSKIVFLFFVSIYSISASRSASAEKPSRAFPDVMRFITLTDFLALVLTFLVAALLDFGMNSISGSFLLNSFSSWFYSLFYYLRIYVPLLLFSIVLGLLFTNGKINFSFRKLCFLLISLWLFNMFSYELYAIISSLIFKLIFTSLPTPDQRFILESIPGFFIIAFYFIGYHSAMSKPFQIFSSHHNIPNPEEQTDVTE